LSKYIVMGEFVLLMNSTLIPSSHWNATETTAKNASAICPRPELQYDDPARISRTLKSYPHSSK
jgi:hypothetical protein